MDIKPKLKRIKELFFKFWRSESGKIALLRDVFVAVIAVLIIVTALWAYTGQWFGVPMVAIETGSMMHPDEPFGRLGTIDPGDMVLLVKVNAKSDVVTYIDAKNLGRDDLKTYGDYGDVIVYRPMGNFDVTQIIHRTMCWVEYDEKYGTYTVEGYDIINETSINIPELDVTAYRPSHSGFITKGDNNAYTDQTGGICNQPIKIEWTSGKARSELPWIGTINLFFNDLTSGGFWNDEVGVTIYNVPSDSLTCLIILIVVLISIPIILDFYDYYRLKKKSEQQ
jgi:signal peptidase